MSDLKWIEIDKDNLPNFQVLAKNVRNVMHIGIINKSDNGDYFQCKSQYEYLIKVTHYIPIAELLKLQNNSKNS